ncbi:MAG TPA: hypothetical protein VFS13_20250 [Steroidobacteraceae bacterium]|jgi:hypothetical protein|nr:hypothetical protein [Steroidobacteraceae bacterium]
MLEREAKRKYQKELFGALALYVVVLFTSIWLSKPMEPGAARTALLLTPIIPILLSIWAIVRQFGRMDEFVRLRTLESFAIAGAVTAGVTFTYGFLESAGFPKLSMFWVWPVMGFVWGVVACGRCLVSK